MLHPIHKLTLCILNCAVATGFLCAQGGNPAQPTKITIDATQRFQTIDGFGVNFNGTYFREAQKPMIDLLIDDLGATIFRLDPYGLLNWEAANDNDDPHKMNWQYYDDRYSSPPFEASWAAARYLNSRGIRPYLALSGIAPDWMLDDKVGPPKHSVCHADKPPAKPTHLNVAMYEEFAEEVVSLAAYARTKARIDFTYFGPINETDCYPAEGPRVDPEEAPQLLYAVAHRLRDEGMGDVRLVVAEQALIANDYMEEILRHRDLMTQVGAFGYHSYGQDVLAKHWESLRNSKYSPAIPMWLTEYGDLNDLDKSDTNEWNRFSLAATQRALRAINDGASAALYWDAYDNYHEHYPRLTFYGLMRNSDHMYSPKKRYYAAKQLYKFVRPGAQRIAVSSDSDTLLLSAFRDPATEAIVLVGVKQSGSNQIDLAVNGLDNVTGAWELYATTRTLNCARIGTASTKGGVVHLELPDEAVFTLVGNGASKTKP